MWIFAFFPAIAALHISMLEDSKIASCSKFEVCLNRFEIPKGIIGYSYSIYFYPSSDPAEYPTAFPLVYLGEDYIPTPEKYSIFLSIAPKSYYLSYIKNPKHSKLIISINGGLTENFRLFPAYTPQPWWYEISITYYFCDIPYYVSPSDLLICQKYLLDLDGLLEKGTHYLVLQVSDHTANLFIEIVSVTGELELNGSWRNFNSKKSYLIKEAQKIKIEIPPSGDWYFIFQVSEQIEYHITLEPCEFEGSWLCGDHYIYNLKPVESESFYENMPMGYLGYADMKIYRFDVEKISLQYAFNSTCQGNITYCYPSPDSIIGVYPCGFVNLFYLKEGSHYLIMNENMPYYLEVYQSILGNDMCTGQAYKYSENTGYVCDCSENTGGIHCDILTTSRNHYLLGVFSLSGSNLFMIPAVILSSFTGFYGESTVFFMNMLISMVYHVCDYEYYCVLEEIHLRLLDFMLSYLSVIVAILYLSSIRNANIKIFIIFSMFLFETCIAFFDEFNGFYSEFFVKII